MGIWRHHGQLSITAVCGSRETHPGFKLLPGFKMHFTICACLRLILTSDEMCLKYYSHVHFWELRLCWTFYHLTFLSSKDLSQSLMAPQDSLIASKVTSPPIKSLYMESCKVTITQKGLNGTDDRMHWDPGPKSRRL